MNNYWYSYSFAFTTHSGALWGREVQIFVTNKGVAAAWLLTVRAAACCTPTITKIELIDQERVEVSVRGLD